MPMKKSYHYFYMIDDLKPGHPDILELDSLLSSENSAFSDVYSFLDMQRFEIKKSVVSELIEYAVRQFGDTFNKSP